MHSRFWLERLFDVRSVRWVASLLVFLRGLLWWTIGRRYRAIVDYCWLVRVARTSPFSTISERRIASFLEAARLSGTNPLIEWYRADDEANRCAQSYSLVGEGSNDIFRDLIVLKSSSAHEKGVVLLKYARTFLAVVAIFDIRKIMERYTFVLEPCWAGYCDPALLVYACQRDPVVVQCFTAEDYEFVSHLGRPVTPIQLGPADWVDAKVFEGDKSLPRHIDLVMVANWGKHKRHETLFKALKHISDRDVKVLLVGFPWAGRTSIDVEQEAARWANSHVSVEFVEGISHDELAERLAQCKVFVFLSRKEGDNKALVEAFFAGVPAVVYRDSVGGATSRVNCHTGILASDEELPEKIAFMLDHYRDFAPREWALVNTGSQVATRKLDNAVRNAVTASGQRYSTSIVEKTNAPNLAYKDSGARSRFQADYDFIRQCIRPVWKGANHAKMQNG